MIFFYAFTNWELRFNLVNDKTSTKIIEALLLQKDTWDKWIQNGICLIQQWANTGFLGILRRNKLMNFQKYIFLCTAPLL